jgi:signal recognition particle GTPase
MRVLKGSGRSKTDINELLKGYDKMKKMTEKMKGGKMKALMQQFSESNQMPREE